MINVCGEKSSESLLKIRFLVPIIIFLLFITVLIRTAWIMDDAAITLRSVANFVAGNGMVYNYGERVQNFTHPLWFFVLSGFYFVIRNIFYATFAASIIFSFVSVILLVRFAIDPIRGAFLVLISLFSNAFIDYCGSGLEQPLLYLLGVILLYVFFNVKEPVRRVLYLWLLFSLFYLTRPDTPLLVVPLVFYETFLMFRQGLSLRRIILLILIGLIPMIGWICFSVIYYGFPFPNTAYAKLGAGIPASELITQGFFYLIDSITYDPFTLLMIFLIGVISFKLKYRYGFLMFLGIMFYLVYIVKIGGDFMSGRFLAIPFWLGLTTLARIEVGCDNHVKVGAILCILIGLLSISVNNDGMIFRDIMDSKENQGKLIRQNGIGNQRLYYMAEGKSLATADRNTFKENFNYRKKIDHYSKVSIESGMGFGPLSSGPDAYYIDKLALTDPLLARLPSIPIKTWRIGHFERGIPDGYEESIMSGVNRIEDPVISNYYEHIRKVVRGQNLFSKERFKSIYYLNRHPICNVLVVGSKHSFKLKQLSHGEGDIIGGKIVASNGVERCLTYGPYVELSEGVYQFNIFYETEDEGIPEGVVIGRYDVAYWCYDKSNNKYVCRDIIEKGILPRDQTNYVSKFEVKENMIVGANNPVFEIRTFYCGTGTLSVSQIDIKRIK